MSTIAFPIPSSFLALAERAMIPKLEINTETEPKIIPKVLFDFLFLSSFRILEKSVWILWLFKSKENPFFTSSASFSWLQETIHCLILTDILENLGVNLVLF